jgi:hypothetical protein
MEEVNWLPRPTPSREYAGTNSRAIRAPARGLTGETKASCESLRISARFKYAPHEIFNLGETPQPP